jgi:Carboxypeptidase regulatory-like domain
MHDWSGGGRWRGSVAGLVMLCASVWPAAAQITTGTVSGSVKDAQGAVVPGATVTLISTARGTKSETQTSTEGDFIFPNVAPGTYTVRVTMHSFKTLERPGIAVSPGDRVVVPREMGSGTGAAPVRGGLCEWRLSVQRIESPGHAPDHGSVPRAEFSPEYRRDCAEHG